MTFKSFELAKQAALNLNNIKLPPKHVLKCYHIQDYNRAMSQGKYVEPKFLTRDLVQGYMQDEHHRDQILFPIKTKQKDIQSIDCYVKWFGYQDKSLQDVRQTQSQTGETSLYYPQFSGLKEFVWSEFGGYLVAMFEEDIQLPNNRGIVRQTQGFHLFGQEKMEFIATFYHIGLKQLKFSPCEKYILSYNGIAD